MNCQPLANVVEIHASPDAPDATDVLKLCAINCIYILKNVQTITCKPYDDLVTSAFHPSKFAGL